MIRFEVMYLKDELRSINDRFVNELLSAAMTSNPTHKNVMALNTAFVRLLELLEIEAEEKSNE